MLAVWRPVLADNLFFAWFTVGETRSNY